MTSARQRLGGAVGRWALGAILVVAAGINGLLFWTFTQDKAPDPPSVDSPAPAALLPLSSPIEGLRLALADPAHLYLPLAYGTDMEGAQLGSLQNEAEAFAPFPPDLALSREPAPAAPEPAADEVLLSLGRLGPEAAVAFIGRSPDPPATPLVEPVKAWARRLDAPEETALIAAPADLLAQFLPDKSARALILVEPEGLVGTPLLVQSSGHADLDRAFLDFLTAVTGWGSLSPGYWSVGVP